MEIENDMGMTGNRTINPQSGKPSVSTVGSVVQFCATDRVGRWKFALPHCFHTIHSTQIKHNTCLS